MAKTYFAGEAAVKLIPNAKSFHHQARRDLATQQVGFKVDLEPDATGFSKKARTRLATVKSLTVDVKPMLDVTGFRTKAQAKVDGMRSLKMSVDLRTNTGAASGELAAWRKQQAKIPVRIPVEVNTAAATLRLAEWRAQQRLLPITIRVDVDTKGARGALRGLRMGQGFGGGNSSGGRGRPLYQRARSAALVTGTVMAPIATQATVGGLAAISGAAANAGAALGMLPALTVAAGAGFAALGVGLGGVIGAFQALKKDAEDSKDVVDNSREIASAQRGIAGAERNLARAHKDVERAQKDLNEERKLAVRRLRDMNDELRLAPLNEREAALAIKEAQRSLREAYASGDSIEIEGAKINLDRAKIDYDILIKKNQDLYNDTMAANKAGIEGDEQVVAAKERVEDANEGVLDAQDALVSATERLAEAMKQESTAANEAADALAKLAPSARAFVLAMQALGPQWTQLRMAVQENLFSQLGDSVTHLANQQLPGLQAGLAGVAAMLNRGMRDSLAVFSTDRAVEDFNETLGNTQLMWAGLADTAAPLSQAWIDLSTVGSRLLPRFGVWAADNASEFQNWIAEMRNSGELEANFNQAIETLKQFGRILSNVGHILGDVFKAGEETGYGMLNTWEQGTAALRTFTESVEGQEALKRFFQGVSEATAALMPILTIVAKTILDTLGPALTDLVIGAGPGLVMMFEGLRTGLQAIAPLMEPLGRVFGAVFIELGRVFEVLGPVIAQTLDALMPALQPVATVFSEIIQGLAPILPLLGQLVGQVLSAVAPAFIALVQALQPVVSTLVDSLMPFVPILAEVFGLLAETIGGALIQVIQMLAPFLPQIMESFISIVQALMPLIPVLLDVAMQILPAFIRALEGVLPTVVRVIDILAQVVNYIVPVLIPVVQFLGTIISEVFSWIGSFLGAVFRNVIDPTLSGIGWALEKLGGFFNWLWFDVIKPVWSWLGDMIKHTYDTYLKPTFDAISSAVSIVGDIFRDIVNGIGIEWAKLKDLAAVPINWVIDVVINGALKDAWNALEKIIPGMDHWDGVPRVEFKASGGYISGKGGPTDDKIPAMLSNGEYVLKASAVDRIGVDTLDQLNHGTFVPGDGPGPRRYASGGYVNPGVEITTDIQRVMWDSIRQAFPNITLTSATRYQDVGSGYDNHMAGRALDLSPIPAAARWIYDLNASQPVEELIHWPLDGWDNLKGGSPLNYDASTNAQHMDHIHWAMAQMLATDGSLVSMEGPGGNSNSGGGGGIRGWIASKFEGPMRAAIDALPDWGDSLIAKLPKQWMNNIVDAALEWMRGKSNEAGSSGGSFDMAPGSGPVMDQVQQVFSEWGWGEGEQWEALKWIVQKESSWNPTARNASSGAFGLFQFNPSSGTMQEYLPDANPNPAIQAEAGRRYIRDRYGDPLGAKVFWEANGWYDQGGIANGTGMMAKNTIEPERVLSPAQTASFEALVPFLQFLLPGMLALHDSDPMAVNVEQLNGRDLTGRDMPVTADVEGRDVTTGEIHGQPLQGAAIDNETGEYIPAQNDPTVGDYTEEEVKPKWWESRDWKIGKSVAGTFGFGNQASKIEEKGKLLDQIYEAGMDTLPAWIAAAQGDPTLLAERAAETTFAWGEKTTQDFANFVPENAGGILESMLSAVGAPLIGTVNTGLSKDDLMTTIEDANNRKARRTRGRRRG